MGRLATTFRILGTALFVAGALLAGQSGTPAAAADTLPHVDVVEVNGLIDPVTADFVRQAIKDAAKEPAVVLIMQLNSGGTVLSDSELARLAKDVRTSPVPIAVWVGPSGGKAKGGAVALVNAAAVAGTSTRTRIGDLTAAQALVQRVVTLNAPTLGDFLVNLDGAPPRNGG